MDSYAPLLMTASGKKAKLDISQDTRRQGRIYRGRKKTPPVRAALQDSLENQLNRCAASLCTCAKASSGVMLCSWISREVAAAMICTNSMRSGK